VFLERNSVIVELLFLWRGPFDDEVRVATTSEIEVRNGVETNVLETQRYGGGSRGNTRRQRTSGSRTVTSKKIGEILQCHKKGRVNKGYQFPPTQHFPLSRFFGWLVVACLRACLPEHIFSARDSYTLIILRSFISEEVERVFRRRRVSFIH
jgi:hypothetical protein